MNSYIAAAIQMVSGADIEANLDRIERLVKLAADDGARLLLLPENCALMSTRKLQAAGEKERDSGGPIRRRLSRIAKDYGVWLIAGSLPVAQRQDGSNLSNRIRAACFVFNDSGEEVARYDKIHLFDVDVEDKYGSYRESASIEPGDEVVTLQSPFGCLGLSICYDLRFPELYRALSIQGAQVLMVPAAFTAATGAAHWESLLRARAIENLSYVVAAGQGGKHSAKRETWGHSVIIDPWGKILAQQDTGEGVVIAELDLQHLRTLRNKMPVASHRRI